MSSITKQIFGIPLSVNNYPSDFSEELEWINNIEYFGMDSLYSPNPHLQSNINPCLQSKDHYVLGNQKLSKIRSFIQSSLDEFMDNIYGTSDRLGITQSWINLSGKGNFHPEHQHPNSIISGVWYPFIDEDLPPIKFKKFKTSHFHLKKHTNTRFNSDFCLIPLNPGDLILFPSDLIHQVPVNESDKKRISLSFNTWVTGNMGEDSDLTYLPFDRLM
mgnify:FL=1